MLFSILIPAYNAEKYIDECLKSIFLQENISDFNFFDDVEILVADDGSTDHTKEILEWYNDRFLNLCIYYKKNEGHILTRKFLVEHAKGKYIIFVDSDDKWEKNLLSTVYRAIIKNEFPDIISYGFNVYKDGKLNKYEIKDQKAEFLDLKKSKDGWKKILTSDNYNSLWTKAIKREVLEKSQIDSSLDYIKRGEDKLLNIRCIENSNNWLIIPEYLYDYRVENSSMTRTFNYDYFQEIIKVEEFVYSKIEFYLKDEESYCKWANSLMAKFVDYIIQLQRFCEYKEKVKSILKQYRYSKIMLTAIYYAKNYSNLNGRIRARIIELEWYNFFRWYYR